jgi:predicted Rossmann-fold nucleotide-binding protein
MSAQPQQQQDVSAFQNGLNDFSAARCGKHVTVYCWSSTAEGSERWQQAERLGAALAVRGYGIVTGGYCGSMHAVSQGAAEARPAEDGLTTATIDGAEPARDGAAAGVAVRGILVPGQFPDRVLVGNPFLTSSVDATSLCHRLDRLSSLTRYYIVLPGTLGSLTELCIIWSLAVLHKQGEPEPVILCFREPWQAAMDGVGAALKIPDAHMARLKYVDSGDECVAIIEADYAAQTAPAS